MKLKSQSLRPAGTLFLGCTLAALAFAASSAAQEPASTAAIEASLGFVQEELIGAPAFRAEHPEYDGRGVTIAIFDTGVDPAAIGMQTTPQGERKIVDLLDCTGAGDLTLVAVEKPAEPTLRGLTGRTLALPPELFAKATELRIGYRHAERFFPAGTFDRVMEDRETRLDVEAREEALASGEDPDEVPTERPADEPRPQSADAGNEADKEDGEKKAREEARERAAEQAIDAGPVYDCVALKIDDAWIALVDTDEDGDLAEEKPLAPFAVSGDYVVLPRPADLTLAVQIARDGSQMTLVTVEGSHGTHCAGIASAYVLERPEFDGVAPGARILSCKIGDSTLDGMETPLALARAFDAAVAYGVDVVSMSYGEPVLYPNRGWLIAEASRLAKERGILFVAAAGNEGPGLSTVGAPGGTTQGILAVGAYVTPEMRSWLDGWAKRTGETLFGFSSRGPAFSGDVGVDILAPGAARTSVPLDEDQDLQVMHGTSMATPHASGAAALLISGMKAEKLPWSPAFLERALKASAVAKQSVFEPTNAGLLDIPAAWDLLSQWANVPELQRGWAVRDAFDDEKVGIYLRDVKGLGPVHRERYTIEPVGRVGDDFADPLRLHASAEWIAVPPAGVATNEGFSFEVEIRKDSLEPGVHAASIEIFDAATDAPLPLASLPVTVVVPHAALLAGETFAKNPAMEAGLPERTFFTVEAASHGAWITLSAEDAPKGSRLMAEIVQRPTRYGESVHVDRWIEVLDDAQVSRRFVPLRQGETAELVLAATTPALSPDAIEPLNVEIAIEAPPVADVPGEIVLPSTKQQTLLHVVAGGEKLNVRGSARLENWIGAWLPTEAEIDRAPVEEFAGDKASRSNLRRLRLTYEFDVAEKRKVSLAFAPEYRTIYDHPAGGWTYDVYDEDGRAVYRGDYRPGSFEALPGSYRAEVVGYATSEEDLEELKNVALHWEAPFEGSKNVDLDPSGARTIDPHASLRFELATRDVKDRPPLDGAVAVEGKIDWMFGVEREGRLAEWTETTRLVRPFLGPSDDAKEDEDAKIVWQKAPEQPERDRAEALIRWLKDVPTDKREAFARTYDALIAEYPEEPFLLQLRLHWLDQEDVRKDRLDETVAAADALLAAIDQPALRERLADRALGTQAGNENRERTDWLKAAVIDALYRKGRAIGYRELPEVVAERPIEDPAALDKAFRENLAELGRWTDLESPNVYLLKLRDLRRDQKFAAAAKLLQAKLLEQGATDEAGFWPAWKRFEIYDSLGWTAEREMARSDLLQRFPDRAAEELKAHEPNFDAAATP
ncbi:MAG TPA: S8 family serine peptidase [Pirellulaceae bacterium]|jgi:tripeptidyl-peptidase-2|nr:S8 family serine peptidase [Pirellulaceae bacterium]